MAKQQKIGRGGEDPMEKPVGKEHGGWDFASN